MNWELLCNHSNANRAKAVIDREYQEALRKHEVATRANRESLNAELEKLTDGILDAATGCANPGEKWWSVRLTMQVVNQTLYRDRFNTPFQSEKQLASCFAVWGVSEVCATLLDDRVEVTFNVAESARDRVNVYLDSAIQYLPSRAGLAGKTAAPGEDRNCQPLGPLPDSVTRKRT